MSQAIDAVLAGTKGFAVALLAPLTARIGNRPRVAGDPSQVLGLCSGPSALAVVEFLGEGSLPTIQALVRDGRGLRIVAGVPVAHAGAEGTLRALGVEVGRWDGKTDGVISAVERAVAAMAAPPAAPARPAVPGAPGAPARAPAAAAPRPPAPGPAAPRPAPVGVSPPARPAATAPAAGAARPAAPAPAVAPRPAAAPQGAAPAARPPAGSPSARPASSSPPASSATKPAAPAPRPAPAPAPPAQAAKAPEPRPAPAPAARPPAPAPVAAQPRPAANFFDDLDADVSVDVADLSDPAPPSVDFHAPGVYVPPAPSSAPAADWPSGLSTPAQADDALGRAHRGTADPARPLHALALRTLESLSDLERAVLAGEPQPIDAAPVRKAAVMRLRVAEALASAPPQGSKVDSAALSAILGEIDELLAGVAPLLASAPAELAPALEAIRNSLVREAIDFSEAAQRAAAEGASPPEPEPGHGPVRARVLSIDTAQGEAPAETRGRLRIVVLAIVIVLAAAYHGYGLLRPRAPGPATAPGAPAHTLSAGKGGGTQVVVPMGNPDAAELEKFKADQERLGNTVVERNGVVVVVPGRPQSK
jgi:hypothetical protein